MSKLLWRAGLLAALMFSIVGASGCVDDVNCSSDSDCSGGTPICDTDSGECIANTIIIDRADKYGLSQLHQLRGVRDHLWILRVARRNGRLLLTHTVGRCNADVGTGPTWTQMSKE